MSFSRWGRYSDWYIYRQSGAERLEDELLSVWNVTALNEFSYEEVSEMLAQGDFSRIRGWTPSADAPLREALSSFERDACSTHNEER